MMANKFDIAIIGAGVSGAAIARKLSSYQIRVALLEKCADVSFGVSKANSGIIHAGFHHPTASLKARLEIRGNLMFEQLQNELNFPFKRLGILVVAFSYEQMKTVEQLYAQGIENGVPNLEICSAEKIRSLEPGLSPDAEGGLYAPTGGVIEPYRYVFSLAESALKNGVSLRTNFKVVAASYENEIYEINSENGGCMYARHVINAAGLYADDVSKIFNAEEYKIIPRKGEEYLLEREAAGFPNHVLFPVPTKNSKGILVIPTVEGTMMIGPTAVEVEGKEDLATSSDNLEHVFSSAMRMIPAISKRNIITSFAGQRPTLKDGDFYIDISRKVPHFIQVAGIQSPGLTASPAIAEYVKDLLKKDGMALMEKTNYDPLVKKTETVRDQPLQFVDKLCDRNPAYGNIICRCESVSEAQIVEAIDKGHTTLDGIKFYTRAGMGRCQGGFCTYKILKIIARETGMSVEEISKRGGNSQLIRSRIPAARLT